jgi:hypothetical protein
MGLDADMSGNHVRIREKKEWQTLVRPVRGFFESVMGAEHLPVA